MIGHDGLQNKTAEKGQKPFSAVYSIFPAPRHAPRIYSHSMVAGGLLEIS